MFNPKDLAVFCNVAETGNMSRTAESQAKTVMAISKQIARLESQLDHALFIRSRRHLSLTEFGKAFKYRAEALLNQHQELQAWCQNMDDVVNGEIRVLCQGNDVVTETLVPWMAEFTALYPQVQLSIDVKESLIDITEDEFDIFWAIGDYLGERFPGLKRRSLWKTKYGVFASPEYVENMGLPTDINQLSNHKVIGYTYNQPSNVLVLQDLQGDPIYATPQCQIKTVAGLVELAEAGLGLINAPTDAGQIQTKLEAGTLVPILEEYWWQDAEVHAYYHPSNPIQSKVRAFLDFFYAKREQWQ